MNFQFSSEDPLLAILTILIGLAILIMGRQILWVFISGLGFILGLLISSQFYNAQHEWEIFLISSAIAGVGALLAYSVQRLAGVIAGFATGWYISILLLGYINPNLGQIESVIPYIMGIISALLLFFYFDWGVIIASSVAGSAIILTGMSLARNVELLILLLFTLIGIVIQSIWFMQEK